MFSSIGLFKEVECPESQQCLLPNCIFAHQKISKGKKRDVLEAQISDSPAEDEDIRKTDEDTNLVNGPRKRRRANSLGRDDDAVRARAGATGHFTELKKSDLNAGTDYGGSTRADTNVKKAPRTTSRNISLLSQSSKARASNSHHVQKEKEAGAKSDTTAAPANSNFITPSPKKVAAESLNPRLLPNPPAPHSMRLKLISMLYEYMTRLNEEVKCCEDHSKSDLEMSSQELVAAVLDEEEKIAKQNPSVYSNVVKLRIVALKKMKLAEWKSERLKHVKLKKPIDALSSPSAIPKVIDTLLSPDEETALLSRLLARQNTLCKHGYIPVAPSEKEIEEARKGVEVAQGWEQCDRCRTRFQVFPGRRAEDGALTSGGTCLYHTARLRRPTEDKVDKSNREPFYACCNESVGKSTGCTPSETHVFKISEAKRLALVMPFVETPENHSLESNRAVCFDCEMGYTTYGMELIRLTATSWPDGRELLDVLVRPLGEILDLNSRFSGVWPKDFASAIPYSPPLSTSSTTTTPSLQLVDSPQAARTLLFMHISPTTPLIGHALENDLNATRIIHPSIVDTALLYPHPRGLPLRNSLKTLMKLHLERDIQMGGAIGHDSKEDARAAGDLVRLRVGEVWKGLKRDGWTVRDGELHPPSASAKKLSR